jgi:hypothetical protein
MSTSALSFNLLSDLSLQQRHNPLQQIRQDFNQLSTALQSGDLSGAQSAYASIQQLLQGGANSTTANPSNTIQNDFSALGQALQTGDLSQAQSAFSQLQQDFQATRKEQATPEVRDQYVASSSQSTLTPAQQVQQEYAQLASALRSGNLSGAQSAFSSLQQALQNQGTPNSSSTNSSGSSNTISNDFNALGQALSSGNLTQAQSAFSQLQNDIQSAQQSSQTQKTQGLGALVQGHHHHGHHHHGGGTSVQSSTSSSDSSSSSTNDNTVAFSNPTPTLSIYG